MKEEYKITVHRDDETNAVLRVFWEKEYGIFYCPTGPAIMTWDKQGNLIEQIHHNKNGSPHKEDGPAWIQHDPEAGMTYEMYFLNGGRDREDWRLPSIILKDSEGNHVDEYFYFRDKLHRDNKKPAIILKHPKSGVAYHESVWEMGHCISVIERDVKSGAITYRGPPTDKHKTEFAPEIYSIE